MAERAQKLVYYRPTRCSRTFNTSKLNQLLEERSRRDEVERQTCAHRGKPKKNATLTLMHHGMWDAIVQRLYPVVEVVRFVREVWNVPGTHTTYCPPRAICEIHVVHDRITRDRTHHRYHRARWLIPN